MKKRLPWVFPLHSLCIAMQRGTLEWWTDPVTKRILLYSLKNGKKYRYRIAPGGITMTPVFSIPVASGDQG